MLPKESDAVVLMVITLSHSLVLSRGMVLYLSTAFGKNVVQVRLQSRYNEDVIVLIAYAHAQWNVKITRACVEREKKTALRYDKFPKRILVSFLT